MNTLSLLMKIMLASLISSFSHKGSVLVRSRRLSFRSYSATKDATSNSDHTASNTEILRKVRSLMQFQAIDALVVPTDDPHMSEYTAEHFNRREFVSGFTGSAGAAIVFKDHSTLFTDGRYHKQAEMEAEFRVVAYETRAGGSAIPFRLFDSEVKPWLSCWY